MSATTALTVDNIVEIAPLMPHSTVCKYASSADIIEALSRIDTLTVTLITWLRAIQRRVAIEGEQVWYYKSKITGKDTHLVYVNIRYSDMYILAGGNPESRGVLGCDDWTTVCSKKSGDVITINYLRMYHPVHAMILGHGISRDSIIAINEDDPYEIPTDVYINNLFLEMITINNDEISRLTTKLQKIRETYTAPMITDGKDSIVRKNEIWNIILKAVDIIIIPGIIEFGSNLDRDVLWNFMSLFPSMSECKGLIMKHGVKGLLGIYPDEAIKILSGLYGDTPIDKVYWIDRILSDIQGHKELIIDINRRNMNKFNINIRKDQESLLSFLPHDLVFTDRLIDNYIHVVRRDKCYPSMHGVHAGSVAESRCRDSIKAMLWRDTFEMEVMVSKMISGLRAIHFCQYKNS